MTKKLVIKPHTLVFLVGPSCCGKSYFAQRIKMKLVGRDRSSVILSSDDQRRELLGDPTMDNMDPHMMPVSAQAFELLATKARLSMSFPVNADVVFVDSTGLDHEMRKQYNIMAKEAGYHTQMVVFDLDREELMRNVAERGGMENVTGRHMKALREKVMPALDRKYWDDILILKSREEITSVIGTFAWDSDNLTECFEGFDKGSISEPEPSRFAVIGDVHECVDELRELVAKLPSDDTLYFIGDLFDKGNNTFAMIDYMIDLMEKRKVVIVKGNHENYIIRRLLGQIEPNHEVEATYMTAVKPLLENEEYREKFLEIGFRMVPFVRIIRRDEKDVYLTHAPVKNKYIGKTSKHALKSQINFRFESRDQEEMKRELEFIGAESSRSHPWHVFGHVAHEDGRPFFQNNKIWLDTGCVHGNKLSAVIFDGNRVESTTVKAAREYFKGGGLFSFKKAFSIDTLLASDVRLSEEEEETVRRVSKGGCKFISGTMSPAPSVVNGPNGTMDIESLDLGMQYFANMGVKELCLQPKFMGSRGQIYLYKGRPDECFATSRNGFKIRRDEPLMEFIKSLLPIYEQRVPFTDELILDGELMPWAALGKGLIEKEFGYYGASLTEVIRAGRLDPVVAGLKNVPVDFHEKLQHLNAFEKQLALYGSDKPFSYEAFGILSVDGKCWMREDNAKVWDMVNGKPSLVIDPTKPVEQANARSFFNILTFEEGYEGVVLKPNKFMPDVLPYMKVRNTEYLRLIYGYDYMDRLEHLCRQKNVAKKAQVALKEYQMGMALLELPEHREKLISAFFGQIAKEKTLDPRL